ncbi:hypothetical protein ACS0PU_006560 [Formica fusca]
MNECAIVLPTEDDKWLEFHNYCRKERLPFVVYADLECVLEKKEEKRTPNTSIIQHHKVYSAGYYARCAFDDASSTYKAYLGENCVSWFVKELYDLALRAKTIFDTDAPMTDLTPDEWERFMSATHCRVCEKPFESEDARVRDHCHLTGRHRGLAHSKCNLNYKETYVIPVFFHNLSGYDAHFIIKDVANAFPGSVDLLPLTKEMYIFFTKNVEDASNKGCFGRRLKLRFMDSFKFLSASLEKLASYLDKSELKIARSEFSDLDDADDNKPAYVGICIRDVSKIRLYEFHYEYMLPLYRDKCKIIYTDTDSLIYRIECEDVYEDMKCDIDRFDTSDYAVNNAYGMPFANKKIPGAMKDENAGAIMTEFVGLRAKMYALRVEGRDDTKRIKGVKSGVVARTITFEDYARCLRRRIEMRREQSCIRSKLHEVYTVSELKVALSPHDDKRYVISGTTDTLPWGHYRIPL